jgi:hypothetical protein
MILEVSSMVSVTFLEAVNWSLVASPTVKE